IILDVAHNEDGIKNLVNQINATNYNHLHIVFGIVKDKEVEKILSHLPTSAKYYFTKAQIARALPEQELLERAKKFNLEGNSYNEVNEALKAAIVVACKDDLIIVCGSVFVVGEVELISDN
ncbi:MAG TPA: bifunctional folylpolyglutamate synthase/dihydrofolate synthase, partial [Chitinophagaceae bacterium]|nr:bifunctional folylpolyglutamate synthase/dihydrofolate synthase [Chitinophagaceae bacterium]